MSEENKDITVQELLQKVLMDQQSDDNETLQILEFARDNSVSLNANQARGVLMLQTYGMNDIANYFLNVRKIMTPVKVFFKILDKLTLADRIKGNAKLSSILKANANPANGLNMDKALAKDVK